MSSVGWIVSNLGDGWVGVGVGSDFITDLRRVEAVVGVQRIVLV